MNNLTNELKNFLINALEEKKAQNINVIDLTGKTDFAHYMIFANGSSMKNISAVAEYIKLEMKHQYDFIANVEGLGTSGWVIVDCGDIIIHIFHPETREVIKVEEIWNKR